MKKFERLSVWLGTTVFLAIFAFATQAQVTNVTTATPYTTVQQAIDAASPGDQIRVDVDLSEGLIVVNKAIELYSDAPRKTITSTSPSYGIQVAAPGVTLRRLDVRNAGTFGIITAPGADNLSIFNVRVRNSGGSGFAITCVDNVLLQNIDANSNRGNAVSITDCNNVTINGIMTNGMNAFSTLVPFTGGIGIYASGLYCTGGVNGVTITGNVDIQEFVALFEQVVGAGSISNVSYAPSGGTPAALPFYVGDTPNNKAYVQNLADAYECASSLIASNLSQKENVYVNEIATGKKYVNDNIPPLQIDFQAPVDTVYPKPGPHTLCITAAATYANDGDTIIVEPGDYYEQVVVPNRVTILGPNAGTDPCVSTAFTAKLYPDTIGTLDGGPAVALITIEHDSVTIRGLDLDGDNPAVASGFTALSKDIDADFGIRSTDFFKKLEITNCIIQNINDIGIQIQKNMPTANLPENVFKTNKILNIPGLSSGAGAGILINMDFTVQIDDNCIDACRSGVRFNNAGAGKVTNNDFGLTVINSVADIDIRANSTGAINCDGMNGFYQTTTFGVRNESPTEINAENNWWASNTGPSAPGGLGSGAKVSLNVDFCPWLDAAPPAGMPVVIDCDNPLTISGRILWWPTPMNPIVGVDSVEVKYSGASSGSEVTVDDGDGSFSIMPAIAGNYVLTPEPTINKQKKNGVNSLDATFIQQHIASGFILFSSPFQWIAADVNEDDKISTADAAILFQSLLNNPIAEGLFKRSWRFVPTNHVFPFPPPTPISPAFWNFPEDRAVTLMPFVFAGGNDFNGIKIGDPNASANPWLRPATENVPFVLRTADQTLIAGETVSLPIAIEGFDDIVAFQYAIAFDPSVLEFDGVTCNPLSNLTESNFGLYYAGEGKLRSAMSLLEGVTFEHGMQHFTLRFKVLQGGGQLSEVFHIDSEELEAEAYTDVFVARPVELSFAGTSGTTFLDASGLALSVRPNPARGVANVYFNLPEAGDVQLRVFDVTGRLVIAQQETLAAGPNTVALPLGNEKGLLLLELHTQNGSRTIKIIAE